MSTPAGGQTMIPAAIRDLRGPRPVDPSVENLLVALTAKIEMHSRLRVWAHEASRSGCCECVQLFKALAETDRAQIDQLLAGLRHHLEASGGTTSVASGERPNPVMR